MTTGSAHDAASTPIDSAPQEEQHAGRRSTTPTREGDRTPTGARSPATPTGSSESRGHDPGKSDREPEDPTDQTSEAQVRGRERHKSFSIHSLIEGEGSASSQPEMESGEHMLSKEDLHTMNFFSSHAQQSEVMSNVSPFSSHGSQMLEDTNTAFNSTHSLDSTSATNMTSGMDNEALAALTVASEAAGLQSERHLDVTSTDGMTTSLSPYATLGGSRASSALSMATTLSSTQSDEVSGRHSAPQLTFAPDSAGKLGRTRSDTAKRLGSLMSTGSAPAQLGEKSMGDISSSASMSSLLRSPSVSSSAEVGHRYDDEHDDARPSSKSGTYADASGQAGSRKKRNKCSPEQFRQLESFFAKNRNPTGKVREELAKRIQMPERSVQVWFQNKRAKTKIAEIKEGIPMEHRTTVSKSKQQQHQQGRGSSSADAASNRRTKKTVIQTTTLEESVIQLPVTSLVIGEWRRIKPLICIFSRRNQSFTWFLSSESVGFKLDCPRTSIRSIQFTGPREPTMHEFTEGVHTPIGSLIVELDRPPQFYMEVFRSGGTGQQTSGTSKSTEREGQDEMQNQQQQKASWRQCSDFTEGKEATSVYTHVLSGPFSTLRQSLIQLRESNGSIAQLVEFHDSQTREQTSRGGPMIFTNAASPTGRTSRLHSADGSSASSQLLTVASGPLPPPDPSQMQFAETDHEEDGRMQPFMPATWAQQTWSPEYGPTQGSTTSAGLQQNPLHPSLGPGSNVPAPVNADAQTCYHYRHPMHDEVSAPQSASAAIDMSALRIDTAGISNLEAARTLDGHQSFHMADGHPSASADHHGVHAWPHSAAIPQQNSVWFNAGGHHGARLHPTDALHVNDSVHPPVASAPAYPIQSFEFQQQQQHLHQQPHQHDSDEFHSQHPQLSRYPQEYPTQMQMHGRDDGERQAMGHFVMSDGNEAMVHHQRGETAASTAPSEETVSSFAQLPYPPPIAHDSSPYCHTPAAAASPPSAPSVMYGGSALFSQPSHVAAAAAAVGFTHPSSGIDGGDGSASDMDPMRARDAAL